MAELDFCTTLFKFGERLPQLRIFSYREKGGSGLGSFINAGRGNRYQDLADLTLDLPPCVNSWTAAPSVENYTELPNLCTLQLKRCLLESPGILSGFRASKLETFELDLHSHTILSAPGFLKELQNFPVLNTLKVHGDILMTGAPSLSLSDCPHPSLQHLSLRKAFAHISPETSVTRLLGDFSDIQQLTLYDLSSIGVRRIVFDVQTSFG
jgi:hypothetical protein